MNKLALSSICVAALMAFANAAHADTISIRGDSWCPYNCDPKDAKPGYMIEIAKEVFGKAGHTVDYQTLTWSRALEKVKAGEFTAAVGAAKDDAPELVYGTAPLGKQANTFAIRADDSFTYNGLASLEGKAVGVISGYAYNDELDAYIEKNKADPKKVQAAAGDDALTTNMNKLVAKRVDLVLEDANVLANQIVTQKLDGKVKITDSAVKTLDLYIAFSPANPKAKEYAALLDKGVDELRTSGKLAAILAKYGVKDWK